MTELHPENYPTKRTHPTVSVVIPALNEAKNLPYVAARMPEGIDEVVFVDGNSVDDTIAVAQQLWPDAKIVTQSRKGKGNALACGFRRATSDIVVMIDADGSTDPAEIPLFVEALVHGADFAKGSRFIAGGGSEDITFTRRLGNWALNAIVNMEFTVSFTDLCYGYNAFWRRHVAVMSLPSVDTPVEHWGDGFEIETLINVRIAASGLGIVEVPSFERRRISGKSNLNVVRDGLRVLRTIRKEYRNGSRAADGSAQARSLPRRPALSRRSQYRGDFVAR
nr:glycosyltransferase family 2 protein [Rhodococcus marinonascens]